MLGSLLNVAANIAVNELNNQQRPSDPNQQRIDNVKRDVASKMYTAEKKSALENDTTVLGLYLHWFLSMFALFECGLHCMLLIMIIVVFSVLYYLVILVSCGKASTEYCAAMSHFIKLYWLYLGFFFGILGNIFVPWRPPLYFWKRGVTFLYPPGFERPLEVYPDLCCCFCCLDGALKPTWQVLESHLISVGCCKCVSSVYCGNEAYTKGMQEADENNMIVMKRDTAEFFNRNYSCSSLEALINGQALGGAGQQPVQGMPIGQQPVQGVPIEVAYHVP